MKAQKILSKIVKRRVLWLVVKYNSNPKIKQSSKILNQLLLLTMILLLQKAKIINPKLPKYYL